MTRQSTTGYSTRGIPTPKIVYASEGRWRELYGHRCVTLKQAERYVAKFKGTRIAYDGEELPPPPPLAPPEPLFENLSPRTLEMLRGMVKRALRDVESED